MFDDKYSAERMPGFNPEEEKRGEYADVWEEANMEEDAPEFQGEALDNLVIFQTDIGWKQATRESNAHFLVGNGKRVHFTPLVIVFDGQIAALVQ